MMITQRENNSTVLLLNKYLFNRPDIIIVIIHDFWELTTELHKDKQELRDIVFF